MFVFDLDGCVWAPEMYEIWGGGSPFKLQENGNVKDCKGEEVHFLGDVRKILYELHTDPKYADSIVGIASTCDGETNTTAFRISFIFRTELGGGMPP